MKLLIYCAGGFGREVVDSVRRLNRIQPTWSEYFFLDDDPNKGPLDYGVQVYTFQAAVERFGLEGCEVVIANGEPRVREKLWEKLSFHEVQWGRAIDHTVVAADTVMYGRGVVITPFCTLSSSAVIGDNVVLNNRAIVGHDVVLGAHTVISSMVNIGGASQIGTGTYIGMGTQIKEGTKIGDNVIVGMGSVVHRDIPDGVIAMGNPARPMRENVDRMVFREANRGDEN